MSGRRLEHAVAAFLRQEFGASVVAIIGFIDILLDDARGHGLADFVPDLERMREAATQLSGLIDQVVDPSQVSEAEAARLRHELRTPLNAIKGYAELLVEEASDSALEVLQEDLAKVADIANRLLGEIDRIVEAAAAPPIDVVGNVLRAIEPLDVTGIRDRSAASGRILIIDDNASNRDLLSRRLVRTAVEKSATEAAG